MGRRLPHRPRKVLTRYRIKRCVMAFDDFLRAVQRAAIWLTDGPRRVFGDIGAMSDVLKLQQNISAVAREVFETSFLEPMAASLKNVTNFIGARNVFGRVADLISLRDVWAVPLFNGPDFLVVANRIAGFAGDLCSSTKWLASVKVFGSSLDSWVNDEITPSISRLKPFKPWMESATFPALPVLCSTVLTSCGKPPSSFLRAGAISETGPSCGGRQDAMPGGLPATSRKLQEPFSRTFRGSASPGLPGWVLSVRPRR